MSFGKSSYQSKELLGNDTLVLFVEDFENQLVLELKFIEKVNRKKGFSGFLNSCNRVCIKMRLNLESQKIKVVKIAGYQGKLVKPIYWRKKILMVKSIYKISYTRIMKNGPKIYPILVWIGVNNGQISFPKK